MVEKKNTRIVAAAASVAKDVKQLWVLRMVGGRKNGAEMMNTIYLIKDRQLLTLEMRFSQTLLPFLQGLLV